MCLSRPTLRPKLRAEFRPKLRPKLSVLLRAKLSAKLRAKLRAVFRAKLRPKLRAEFRAEPRGHCPRVCWGGRAGRESVSAHIADALPRAAGGLPLRETSIRQPSTHTDARGRGWWPALAQRVVTARSGCGARVAHFGLRWRRSARSDGRAEPATSVPACAWPVLLAAWTASCDPPLHEAGYCGAPEGCTACS